MYNYFIINKDTLKTKRILSHLLNIHIPIPIFPTDFLLPPKLKRVLFFYHHNIWCPLTFLFTYPTLSRCRGSSRLLLRLLPPIVRRISTPPRRVEVARVRRGRACVPVETPVGSTVRAVSRVNLRIKFSTIRIPNAFFLLTWSLHLKRPHPVPMGLGQQ